MQFTPDLLPGRHHRCDIFDQRSGDFEFHRGPIFANIVLADEINRASPKTQSALLEVMEEGQVTVDGITHTSRPVHGHRDPEPDRAGRHLPPSRSSARPVSHESLDRYPDHDSTVALLADAATRDRAAGLEPKITANGVRQMATLADGVHVDPSVLSYVSQLAHESRQMRPVKLGLSVRGSSPSSEPPRLGPPPTAAATWSPMTSRN